MKTYEVRKKDEGLISSIDGDSLFQAIEGNLNRIIENKIGNSAGCKLENVWLEYVSDGMAALHVVGCGSDSLVNYDAINDKPKDVVFEIHNVDPDEIKEPYTFELMEEEVFDPFEKKWHNNKMACLGILVGTINYIGRCHCTCPDKDVYSIENKVFSKFPTLFQVNTQAFLNQMNLYLQRFRPKSDKKTRELMELVEELSIELMDIRQLTSGEVGSAILFSYKTQNALSLRNKRTALSSYREKAGKSQQQVADDVGISLRQYQRYESVTSTMSDAKFSVIKKIADVFGIGVEDILKNGQVVYFSE